MAKQNTDVHKTVNQFLIDAVDAYVNGSTGIVTQGSGGNPDKQYVVKEELDALRREIRDELKTEMIVILGLLYVLEKQLKDSLTKKYISDQLRIR